MANQLVVSLIDVATFSANQTGEATDIGTRTAGYFRLNVSAVSGSGQVIYLETSPDNATWATAFQQTVVAPLSVVKAVSGLKRYVRARINVASGSILAWASIEAHQVYIDPGDIHDHGIPAQALEGFSDEDKLKQCLAATDECDVYLGSSYTLPLIQWGLDLRMHAAKIAARHLLDTRGWDPEGPDASIALGYSSAIKWLDRISDGKLKPPGIIDSTPETFEGGSFVVSGTKRGW